MHVVLLCTWRKLLGQHHVIGAAHLGEFILRVRLGCTCLVAPDCHLQFRCTFIEGYSQYRTQKDDRCLCTRTTALDDDNTVSVRSRSQQQLLSIANRFSPLYFVVWNQVICGVS